MPSIINASPSPRNEIRTWMNVGYNFNSAMSDIIDNSVSASSSKIHILIKKIKNKYKVIILDDGCGMTDSDLIENMKIACKSPAEKREKGDLGRYGTGMKTASFSIANSMTVYSKAEHHKLNAARWNIDEILERDEWFLEFFNDYESSEMIGDMNLDIGTSGTAIVLENLHCVKRARDEETDKLMGNYIRDLKSHISLYFHRFIEEDNLKIYVNGDQLFAFDPFMKKLKGYELSRREEKHPTQNGVIKVTSHLVPYPKHMSKENEKKYGGWDNIKKKSGFYIYREKRLIIEGNWFGLMSKKEVAKLSRIQIDIPSSTDDFWSIDLKKTSIQLPQKIKEILKKVAEIEKNKSGKKQFRKKEGKVNEYWNYTEDSGEDMKFFNVNFNNENLQNIVHELNSNIKKSLYNYLALLSMNLPFAQIHASHSADSKKVTGRLNLNHEQVRGLPQDLINKLKESQKNV